MSTYYMFYMGYKTKDGKFHAYGPYDKYQKLCPMLCKSRSFISELIYDFHKIDKNDLDEELYKKFVYKGLNDKEEYDLSYLPIEKTPETNFIKTAYIKKGEVEAAGDDYSFFASDYCNIMSKDDYRIELESAVRNNDTERIEELKEYIYHCYPDYDSKEFDSFILNHFNSFNGPFWCIEDTVNKHSEEWSETVILMEIC